MAPRQISGQGLLTKIIVGASFNPFILGMRITRKSQGRICAAGAACGGRAVVSVKWGVNQLHPLGAVAELPKIILVQKIREFQMLGEMLMQDPNGCESRRDGVAFWRRLRLSPKSSSNYVCGPLSLLMKPMRRSDGLPRTKDLIYRSSPSELRRDWGGSN